MDKLTFLTGREGSGRSAWIRAAVKSSVAAGKRAFLIVPEQYTFEAERELAEYLGRGLIGAGVYSFTSLARRVRRETGNRQIYLSKQGSRMVVRRVIADCRDELTAFARVADTRGFAEKLVQLFAMFRGSGIEPAELARAAEQTGELLGSKLRDLALIYGRVREYLAGRYMDENDMIDALIAGIPSSELAGADVFVDGFPKLNNQAFRVLETLMEHAAALTVSFCLDSSRACRDRSVFTTDARAYDRLSLRAAELGIAPDTVALPPADGGAAPELRHIERELFAIRPRRFDRPAGAVTLFAASDEAAEAEAAASAVARAARDGIRYCDMAVMTTSDALLPAVARALENNGIPAFADIKKPLAGYPEARLIAAAAAAVAEGSRPQDVLAIAKTGLAGVTGEDTEALENYILRYGVRGSSLTKPFDFGEVPEGAERARAALMEPLEELRESMSRAGAAEKAEALFRYIERLDAAGSMARLAAELRAAGRLREADETAQVNNAIMELLDQLYAIMGDSRISNRRFLELLREGLAAGGVGVIPTTADQVLLGSLARTRARTVRALFLAGCNEGLLPAARLDEELIDDRELEELKKADLPVWGGMADELAADTLNIYTVFAKPTERLWLGWSLSSGGAEAQPSTLIDRVAEALPDAARETDIGREPVPCGTAAALPVLAAELRELVDTGEAPAAAAELYGALARSPYSRDEVRLIESALYHTGAYDPLGEELAELLYGRGASGSISRLEMFSSCPFRHFAAYGLKLQKRREYRELPADEGGYYHELLESYVKAVAESGADWKDISFPECRHILAPIMLSLAKEHNDGVLLSTPRMRARLSRMEEAALYTAWAVTRQMQQGAFRPAASEVRFGFEGGLPPLRITLGNGRVFLVRGVIDRVDEAVLAGQRWFRVIDYKRSDRKFDPSLAAAGISIQLPVYVAALLAADSAARAAGMFYMPSKRPDGQLADGDVTDVILDRLMQKFRLSGVYVSDAAVTEALDSRSHGAPPATVAAAANSAVTEAGLGRAVASALGSAERAFAGIAAGDIAAYPYRQKKKLGCEYCDYPRVCAFDGRFRDCKYRDIPSLTLDELTKGGAEDGD